MVGSQLVFRLADTRDAEFILSLRLDPGKNAYLSPTCSNVDDQRKWIERCDTDPDQIYFVIEDIGSRRVGTVRLSDVRGSSFSWGSWILSDEAPKSSAIESTLMVYDFGFACGFRESHFEVRRENERVWQYHERFGARRVGEDDRNYYYAIGEAAIRRSFRKYVERIPNGVLINW